MKELLGPCLCGADDCPSCHPANPWNRRDADDPNDIEIDFDDPLDEMANLLDECDNLIMCGTYGKQVDKRAIYARIERLQAIVHALHVGDLKLLEHDKPA